MANFDFQPSAEPPTDIKVLSPGTAPEQAPALVGPAAPPAESPATEPTEPAAPVTNELDNLPWLFPAVNPDGSKAIKGKGAQKPENIPGTPEWEITWTPEKRSQWSWLADKANGVGFFNDNTSRAIFGVSADRLPSSSGERTKVSEEAVKRIVKLDIPKSDHEANLVGNKIVPFAQSKYNSDVVGGNANAEVFGLNDKEIEQFVLDPNNKIPTEVAMGVLNELADSGLREEKFKLGTSVTDKIREKLLYINSNYSFGEKLSNGNGTELDGKTNQEKIDGFKAIAYYNTNKRKGSMSQIVTGGVQFIQDGVEAVAGFADAVNPLTSSEYLSDKYRNSPELKQKAEDVMARSMRVISERSRELKSLLDSGNAELYDYTFNKRTDFSNAANDEYAQALYELAALHQDGAFQPGKTGEKLASFGLGVINSTRNFKHFVSDSVDPGSFLFLRKHLQNKTWVGKQGGLLPLVEYSIEAAYDAVNNDPNYWATADDKNVLAAANQWIDSKKNISSKDKNLISQAYTKLGMENVAKIAETAYGDERLTHAAEASFDPITIGLGGLGLLGKLTGGTAAAIEMGKISATGKALLERGSSIGNEIKAALVNLAADEVTSGIKSSIKTLIDDVAAKTGRTITEAEAIAISLADASEGVTTGTAARSAAKTIKDGVSKVGFPEEYLAKIAEFQKDAAAHAQSVAGKPAGERFLSGFVGRATGATTEVAGRLIRKTGELATGGSEQRLVVKMGLRALIEGKYTPSLKYVAGGTAVAAGGSAVYTAITGGDYWDAAYWGLGGSAAGMLLRPGVLASVGSSIETSGQVINRISKAAQAGAIPLKAGTSPIGRALDGLRVEMGASRDAIYKAKVLEPQLNMLKWMTESGFEDAARAGFHVVVDQGISGGTTGMAMAWANDRDSKWNGFGIGAGSSFMMHGLGRLNEITNKPTAEAVRSKEVMARLIAIVSDPNAMPDGQHTRIAELIDSKKTWKEQVEIADRIVKMWDANQGQIYFNRPGEQAAATLTTHIDPKTVAQIRKEALAIHKEDATAASILVEQRLREIDKNKQSKVNLDSLDSMVAESNRKLDTHVSNITKINANISSELDTLKAAGRTDSRGLTELRNKLSNEENAYKIAIAENGQLVAQHSEAKANVVNPLTFRKNEVRTLADGSGTVTNVGAGLYLHEGPNARTIHIDMDRADAMTMTHEAMEALLHSDAVRPIAREMNDIMWVKNKNNPQSLSVDARDTFFRAYMNSMPAEQAKQYKAQFDIAKQHFDETGSTVQIERYTREAMAWFLAAVDESRPDAYGRTSVNKARTLRDVFGGDFVMSDKTAAELNGFFDPIKGMAVRTFAKSYIGSLREAGWTFLRGSDGDVRGYVKNGKNEIVRDPLIAKLYESVIRITGGKGSPRVSDLVVGQMTHQQQAQLFTTSGLSWLVDPATQTPIPGMDAPQPAAGGGAKPTPPPAAPAPEGGALPPYTQPTHNGKPVGPGTATPTPAPTPGGPLTPPPGSPTPPPAPTTGQTTGTLPQTPVITGQVGVPAPRPPVVKNPSQMPSLGVMTGNHNGIILNALRNVRDAERGLNFSIDYGMVKMTPTVIWGMPSASDISAVANSKGLPDTIRTNMVKMLTALSQPGERPIWTARYVNKYSRNLSETNETRRLIGGDDNFQYVSDRTFVPLYMHSTTRYVNLNGDFISAGQFEKLEPKKQYEYTQSESLTIKAFDVEAFQNNTTAIFNEGLRVYSKEKGSTSFTYLKDAQGNDMTAARVRQLFNDDVTFRTMANNWMEFYMQKGGMIDPTQNTPINGKLSEPSSAMLGDGDLNLGEARLTALRFAFAIETRKGRLHWVAENRPTTFTNEAVRGLRFPWTDLDPTLMGEMQDTGGRSLISQEVHTHGAFNQAPGAWQKIRSDIVTQLHPKTPFVEATAMWKHPDLPNTVITEFKRPGVRKPNYTIIVDGIEIGNVATSHTEAVIAASDHVNNARAEADTRAYAEKVLKDEATRRAKEDLTAENARKKSEAERTAGEQKLIDEVRKKNAKWLAQMEKVSAAEAKVVAEGEAIKAKRDVAETKASAQRLADADAAAEKNKLQYDEVIAERARIARELRDDIIQRSKDVQQQDADALAVALRSDAEKLDVAGLVTKQLKVDPSGLPIAIVNNPLVVTRVAKGKPFVIPSTSVRQQVGPAVDAARGNTQIASLLGSQEVQAQIAKTNAYLNIGMPETISVNNAINDVWKTELGNKLAATYEGMNSEGKHYYTYRIYGVNGMQQYVTRDANAAYKALRLAEDRRRGLTEGIKLPPSEGERMKSEALRYIGGRTYMNSKESDIERSLQEQANAKYNNKGDRKYQQER